MLRFSLLACLLLLSGCMQIRTELQLKNADVKPLLEGRDCLPIIGGLGFGTNTVEEAMRHGVPVDQESYYIGHKATPIRRIHSVSALDTYFIMFGDRCLLVTGE